MGTLVFQATLGGQINLTGTNTASTFTITVPALTGTMASLAAVTNNGVAYVNSSGQPTSGSALVFDGTNVGIGLSSPSSFGKLAVTATSATTFTGTAVSNIGITGYVNTGDWNSIVFTGNSGTPFGKIGVQYTTSGSYLSLGTTNSFASGITNQALTIDPSGNVGIGVTPSAWGTTNSAALQIKNVSIAGLATNDLQLTSNAYFDGGSWRYIASSVAATNYYQSAGAHVWRYAAAGTAGNVITYTNAMSLDTSGNLLVGTTSGSDRLIVKSAGTSSAAAAITVQNSAGTELLRIRNDGVFYTGGATFSPYNNTTGSAANMVVGASGDLFRSTSSIKYKKNIVNATHGLAELLALRAVTYEGKSEADDGKTFGGLIAEEVHEAGLTEFVQYAKDGSPDALAYGNMVSLCIKAIQEQQALIESLTTRLTALEQK